MKLLDEKINILKEYLSEGGKKIAIVAHTNPDGDALGSSLALRNILHKLGHKVNCLVPNGYPYFLEWIEGIGDVIINKENKKEATEVVEKAEIIICVDFNRIDRLDELSEVIESNTTAKRVLIDHHQDPPENEYDLSFSYTESCSTAFIIYNMVDKLTGLDAIDKASAEALYVGIMTDTGNFSFSYLTPELFRAVAVLVEKGIDIPAINKAVYNAFTESRVRLLGFVLDRKMKLIHNNEAAYMSLKESEMRRFNFQIGDSEGFVNYPLTISNVKISAMFIQTCRFIRISFRSRGSVDVNLFASKYYNGGGHKNAAGGKSFESMDKTIEKYIFAVKEFFSEENL